MSDWQQMMNRAGRLFDEDRLDEACTLAEQALRINPHSGLGYQVLGMSQVRRHNPRQAIEILNHALSLQPDLVPARCQLGVAYTQLGEVETAMACFDTAVRFKPDHAPSRFNRAQIMLQLGNYRDGWREFEWRWNTGLVARPTIPRPYWDGRSLNGRSILVHTEQGIGDTLQFIRFLTNLKEQGARLVFACQKPLHDLLRGFPPVDEWFPIDEQAPINFELVSPLLCLPGLLGVETEADIAMDAPYVHADPERVEKWRPTLESMKGLKIGFNWQGKPTQSRDALRSIPLELFEPLAKLPNVTLVNLHKGSGESQIEPNRERVPMVVLDDMDNNGPFMDTAAAMKQVDLVISTDTSIVHLAGSMGVPVWVPIATSCDWRFGIDRTDSPWYPSMRLFRQKAFQVWEPVIAEIVDAVRELQRESVTIQSQGADSADDPAMPRLATSIGELVDKITILEIKSERIDDEDKLSNVRRELELLNATRDSCGLDAGIDTLAAELKSVNEKLWDVEDDVRACEDAEDFGDRFVELARSVYKLNDQRSALKRQINEATGSALKEEKSYGAEAEKSA